MKKAAVLFSGGKDSTYTIDILRSERLEVSCLITIVSENKDSYMLHTSNIHLAELSARALDIPHEKGFTLGKKEEELQDITRAVLDARDKYEFEYIACGGIASTYQKTRIESIAKNCDLISLSPLWNKDQTSYLGDLVKSDYEFMLTSVSCAGLDQNWLGKPFDRKMVENLIALSKEFRFNPALEGGEGETVVLDCPMFKSQRIQVIEGKKEWDGYVGRFEITKARLQRKNRLQV